ncbi:MAG: tyrosine-type recombinase/integrase [Leptospirales bacterium]
MAREGGRDRGVLLLKGVWYARYYVDGKEVREKCDTKSQAKAIYGKRKGELREGRYFPKVKTVQVIFKDLTDDYLRYAALHHKRQGDDIPRVQTWLNTFGTVPAEDVKPSQVEEVMARLKEEGMEPATIHRRLTVLKAIFNRAEKAGIITKNPVRNVKPPRYDNSLVRFLDMPQEGKLFECLPAYLIPIVTVALHTGCRQGELLKLEWRDMDFDRGMFLCRDTKGGGSRWVPINSLARKTLLDLCPAEMDPASKVFQVGHAKSLSRAFAVAVKKAGLEPFRFHDLRHTFASRLAMNGANDRTLQTLGGWKTPRMLLRYSHLGPSHLQDAVEGLVKPTFRIVDDLPVKSAK